MVSVEMMMCKAAPVWWMHRLLLITVAVSCGHGLMVEAASSSSSSFKFGFYDKSCPDAEKIVTSVVEAHFKTNPGIAPGVLRMHFHDCFVEVLLLMFSKFETFDKATGIN
jgi:hypothetical protein